MPNLDSATIWSIVIGGLIGWLVQHTYWKLSKRVETLTEALVELTEQVRGGLSQQLRHIHLARFFTPNARPVTLEHVDLLSDDTPYLEMAIFDKARIVPGDSVEVLLKVADLGNNFENPQGARVVDRYGRALPLLGLGFGVILTTLTVPPSEAPGRYSLTVHLQDDPGTDKEPNRMTYQLPFAVSSDNPMEVRA